jgi:hypothetical protein
MKGFGHNNQRWASLLFSSHCFIIIIVIGTILILLFLLQVSVPGACWLYGLTFQRQNDET